MEKEKRLPFGKKVKCCNFLVLKYTKTLSKSDLKTLRNTVGIPADVQKHLQRGGLPFIRVEALSGIWGVEYCCNTQMFMVIDNLLPLAIDASLHDVDVTTSVADLAHLFAMMMTDTMVVGDEEYQRDKALAMKGFMERQKPAKVSEEEDAETLETLKTEDEARAAMDEMVSVAEELSKEKGMEGKEA